MKTFRTTLLTIATLLCSIAASAHNFEVNGIYYNITSSEDLTVEVTYQGSSCTSYYNEYRGEVAIPESVTYNGNTYSVTSIGKNAFYECRNLTGVTIGNSVTSIGNHAFWGSSSLTSITIPNSVTSIGQSAFNGCSDLTGIIIGNSVTSIGQSAFIFTGWWNNQSEGLIYLDCYLLGYKGDKPNGEITIKDGTKCIGENAFQDCSDLTSITIPSSVTSIGSSAFYYCSRLKSVTIPEFVTSIGSGTFWGCSSLTSITIPNSVTSIGSAAFRACSSLESVTIGNSVMSIGASAFNGTEWWDNQSDGLIYLDCYLLGYKGDTPDGEITIKDGTKIIGGGAFSGCSGLTSVIIPESVTSIGSTAFSGCSSLTSITIPESETSIGNSTFLGCSSLTSITIPNSVTSIGSSAFSGCSGLTSVTIGNSVTSIGYQAFSSCPGLESVTIGNSVTSIGYQAFFGCFGLTNITIPNSVTSIGYEAFQGCSGLTTITIPNSVMSIEHDAFRDCSGLTSFTIPNSVTSIEYDVFRNCSGLTSITIPNSVTSIGYEAFQGCSGLTSITIGNSVTSIGDEAFSDCSSLTSITIPNSVTNIESGAFYSCSGLTSVTIGNSVTSIEWSAFEGCSKLKTVINFSDLSISRGSSSNGHVAYYADRVINVDEQIGNFYFRTDNDGIRYLSGYVGADREITLPNDYNSENYVIEERAFYGCTGLNTLVIGTGVTSIGENQTTPAKTIWLTNTPPGGYSNLSGKINYVANEQYSSLRNTKVYPYLSSMFEVDGVKYVPVNMSERTCDAIDCRYDSSVENVAINSTVSYKGIEMTVKEVMPYAFYNNDVIKSLTLGNQGSIGESTFQGCTNLQEVTLSESVTSIGASAFKGCSSLPEITIPSSVTKVGDNAFYGCSSLPKITIPQSVFSIGDYAFNGCTALADVIICDRTEALSLGANGSSPLFADCPLDSVYIGGKITYNTSSRYGYSPFYRKTSLRAVVIGDKEEAVYDNEFYGCTNLKSVTIGNGVKSIGNWAFSGCSSLEQFSFGNKVESIGQEAFSDCTGLTELISHAVVPPVCGAQALEDINKWNCTLKVPESYKAAYQSADQWKDFFFIEDVVSSIDKILLDETTTADIYTIDGRLYMKDADVKEVKLPRGLYIIGGKKVMVK